MQTKDGQEFTLRRENRKTISVTVREGGVVEVKAPRWVPANQIEEFLFQKQKWIATSQSRMLRLASAKESFSAEPGSVLPLLGMQYPVRAGTKCVFDGSAFWIDSSLPAKRQLRELYRKLARKVIQDRLDLYSPLVGVSPATMRITSASTRFGSCSGKNGLSFTWKLVMADLDLVDYVVVHELCHIREHNHSARFWQEVARVLPDYRERESRLKAFSEVFHAQDWEE